MYTVAISDGELVDKIKQQKSSRASIHKDKIKLLIKLASFLLLVTVGGLLYVSCDKGNLKIFGRPRQKTLIDKRKPWIEKLSWTPRAFLYHNFLTEKECAHIIALAAPSMTRSLVLGDLTNTGEGQRHNARTSYGTFLPRSADSVLKGVQERASLWSKLPVENMEDMQVLRYGPSQKYSKHYDALNRSATILLYLNDVEEGGETAFPLTTTRAPNGSEGIAATYAGAQSLYDYNPNKMTQSGPENADGLSQCAAGRVAVRAKKGDALMFFSYNSDGVGMDVASLHTGCPVIRGVKWTATLWFHISAQSSYTGMMERWDPGECADDHAGCPGLAAAGKCEKHGLALVGTKFHRGTCRLSCGACQACGEGDEECYAENRRGAGFLHLGGELEELAGRDMRGVVGEYVREGKARGAGGRFAWVEGEES